MSGHLGALAARNQQAEGGIAVLVAEKGGLLSHALHTGRSMCGTQVTHEGVSWCSCAQL